MAGFRTVAGMHALRPGAFRWDLPFLPSEIVLAGLPDPSADPETAKAALDAWTAALEEIRTSEEQELARRSRLEILGQASGLVTMMSLLFAIAAFAATDQTIPSWSCVSLMGAIVILSSLWPDSRCRV